MTNRTSILVALAIAAAAGAGCRDKVSSQQKGAAKAEQKTEPAVPTIKANSAAPNRFPDTHASTDSDLLAGMK